MYVISVYIDSSDYCIRFLAPQTIYPPTKICWNEGCSRTRKGISLQKAEHRQAVLYTLDNGVLPVWSVHFYCQGSSEYTSTYIVHTMIS